MRDNAGGKDETCLLRCAVDRSQQAPSGESGAARLGIDHDLAHSRQVDHHPAIAGAKTGEAMPSTTDRSENPGLRAGSDRALHVTHIGTARNKARSASYHSIPNGARVFVAAVAGAHQIAFESLV